MPIRKDKIRRLCKECGKKFKPSSRYSFICIKCKKELFERRLNKNV